MDGHGRKLEANLELSTVWTRDEAFGVDCVTGLWLTWGVEETSDGRKRQRMETLRKHLTLGIITTKRSQQRRQRRVVTEG